MPRGVYKPNAKLLTLLGEFPGTTVQVTEIRNAYERKYQTGKPKADLRRWIQGQFRTLEKHGYLIPEEGEQSPKQYLLSEEIKRYITQDKPVETQNQDVVTSIRSRLADVKVALIQSEAEANEYEMLGKLYPTLRTHLRAKFSQTKEKQLSLNGQLMAIESALQSAEQHL